MHCNVPAGKICLYTVLKNILVASNSIDYVVNCVNIPKVEILFVFFTSWLFFCFAIMEVIFFLNNMRGKSFGFAFAPSPHDFPNGPSQTNIQLPNSLCDSHDFAVLFCQAATRKSL